MKNKLRLLVAAVCFFPAFILDVHAVAAAYIKYMDKIFAFLEKLSREFLGYEVKQTLLLHTNELNADHFDELVGVMRRRGYTFVGLEAALQDKAYSLPDATRLSLGARSCGPCRDAGDAGR